MKQFLLSLYKKNLFLLKEIVIIMNPIHECATAVNVHRFIPHAIIQV
ncbi:hypothetical protein [Bacillus thuringiensis]|nr:hypothetical protein [Bacillus thuringiensis]